MHDTVLLVHDIMLIHQLIKNTQNQPAQWNSLRRTTHSGFLSTIPTTFKTCRCGLVRTWRGTGRDT